jgi:hypothetical protein
MCTQSNTRTGIGTIAAGDVDDDTESLFVLDIPFILIARSEQIDHSPYTSPAALRISQSKCTRWCLNKILDKDLNSTYWYIDIEYLFVMEQFLIALF